MRIALCGIGRAGSEVARALKDHSDLTLVAGLCRPHSNRAGRDIGELAQMPFTGITAREITEVDDVFGEHRIDVVIDFSNPAASRVLLDACRRHGVAAVVCTTGFSDAEIRWIRLLAKQDTFGVVYAPNVTAGVNVLMSMARILAQKLQDFDFEITEMHHKHKKDAPSGTAKKIANLLEKELFGREGGFVPIHAVRAGGYIGHHEVLAVGEYEMVHIIHESFSRRAFAEGAIRAARFLAGKKGWYSMEDVLMAGTGQAQEQEVSMG